MPYPPGLHVEDRPPLTPPGPTGPPAPVVVLVHGSLDRAASFRRTGRRLEDLRVVTYDRRGYQGSRRAGPTTLAGHVEDLVAVVSACADQGEPVAVVGHSFGGTVAVGAALAAPERIAAVGAWEPPMGWLGFRRRSHWAPLGEAAAEVEAFFSRMVGEGAWARLGETARASRVADGPALLADLAALRADAAPFDVTALKVPSVFGCGGAASAPHHRATVAWLAAHVPGAERVEVPGAGHGIHLSSPDAFAGFVRHVVDLARRAEPATQGCDR